MKIYYIPQLVRALWLINFGGSIQLFYRNALYDPLRPAKFKKFDQYKKLSFSFLSRVPDEPQRYKKYLTNLVCWVRAVSYESSFFPFDLWHAFGA